MLTRKLLVFYASVCFLIFLSNYEVVSIVAMVALIIILLLSGKPIAGQKSLLNNAILFLPVIYYIVHVVSLLYTTNFKYAIFDLESKLSLIAFPLIFSVFSFGESDTKKVLRAFILGCALSAIYCLVAAAIQFTATKDFNVFFYISLSRFMHPTYISMMLNLAVILAFHQLFWDNEKDVFWRRLLIFSIVINSSFVILLMSRTAFAVFIFTLVLIFIIFIYNKRIYIKDNRWLIGLIAVMVLLFMAGNNKFNRFRQVETVIQSAISSEESSTKDIKEENSTTTRIKIWQESINLITQHPLLGVGIGDIKDELVKKYHEDNFEYGVKGRFNPHNQYLHTTVSLGAIGLSVLLLMLFVPFIHALRNRDWIYVMFLAIIILNGMTESILERQAGILFFAFFNSFFASGYRKLTA